MAKGKGKGGKTTQGGSQKVLMTPKRASEIQSATAIKKGTVKKNSFAARAIKAAAKNINNGLILPRTIG